MGYCIDDLCHAGDPICGAPGPHHCRNCPGPPVDDLCTGCGMCGWDDDIDDDWFLDRLDGGSS